MVYSQILKLQHQGTCAMISSAVVLRVYANQQICQEAVKKYLKLYNYLLKNK